LGPILVGIKKTSTFALPFAEGVRERGRKSGWNWLLREAAEQVSGDRKRSKDAAFFG